MQKPDPLAMIKIAITNIFADGCYTAPVFIGSEKSRINVFLDTGSSSLAVNRQHYDPGTDRRMAPTNLVQEVAYEDDSGWKGAVVRTRVAVRHFREQRRLDNVPVAVADWQKDIFVNEMQGILGLAYTDLDY
ncbi:MAG: pepsin-like aspartyl protease, partial [Gammaproteobacteria bacterium]|nr:pepsin-like aspartyl protease [Gammaproteobacteria bacterium]